MQVNLLLTLWQIFILSEIILKIYTLNLIIKNKTAIKYPLVIFLIMTIVTPWIGSIITICTIKANQLKEV